MEIMLLMRTKHKNSKSLKELQNNMEFSYFAVNVSTFCT